MLDRFASWWDATGKVPKSLTESDVERFIWGRHSCTSGCKGARFHVGPGLSETMEATTLRQYVSRLRQFLAWAFRSEYVRGEVLNACDERVKVRRRRRLQLTVPQLEDLYLGAKDPYERIICALATYTGARGGELNTLRIGDVDLEQGEIAWGRHKTGDYEDSLPIMKELDGELRRWLDFYRTNVGDGRLSPRWFLVPHRQWLSHNETMRFTPDQQRVQGCFIVVKKHLARVLDLPLEELRGEGVHTVRRSVARRLYERLCDEGHPDPIAVVQALLGHASRVMTERYIGVETARRERDRVLRGRSALGGRVDRGQSAGV